MKKVFITGGTRGIGRCLVEFFLAKGYQVGFTYCKSHAIAQELVEQGQGRAAAFCADFSDMESVHSLLHEMKSRFGEPDAVIHNAGVASYGLAQDVTEEEFDHVFGINFKSVFFLTKELIKPMIAKKKGAVLLISSVWGQTGASCEVLYSASKAAGIGYVKALAKELAPSGISVNAIAPGIVDTEMMARFTEEEKNSLLEEIPSGAFVDPVDIARAALFFVENDSAAVTGQILGINGGMLC